MGRTRRVFNPTNFIRWADNLQLFTTMSTPLIGQVRLLIDQALGTGTMLDYPVSGDIFWPSQQLYDATNEVLVDYWPMLARMPVPIQLGSATLTTTASQDIYAIPAGIMIPTYVVLNQTVSNVTIDQKYWTSDLTKLEQYSRQWRTDTPAQPKWFVLWDSSHIRTYPKPDKTYAFTLFGVPWPTEMGTGTEDISGDQLLKLAIAYRAAANILECTRPDIADAYSKESEELTLRIRVRLRDQQTNNLRRLKPGVGARGSDRNIAAAKGVIRLGRSLS